MAKPGTFKGWDDLWSWWQIHSSVEESVEYGYCARCEERYANEHHKVFCPPCYEEWDKRRINDFANDWERRKCLCGTKLPDDDSYACDECLEEMLAS